MRRVTLGFLLLVACSPRGDFTAAPPSAAAPVSEAIFVGTTRTEEGRGFGFVRADQARFLRYDISIPKDRIAGELNWPPRSRPPDANRDFLTLAETRFATEEEFREELRLAMRRRDQTTAVIYVHGFNTTMAEGVYRVAQMHHDLRVPGLAVHFSWPSRASALGYISDRDSALFSRSGFEDLLDEVAAAGAREIVIVSHSMGAALTMETLRQMALRGDSVALSRVKGVILIAPDIDVDVFRSQARDIGDLPQPFVVFGSSKDRVLNLSARVAGSSERLGNLESVEKIADLQVLYLETAAFDIGPGHLNLGKNPALIKIFSGVAGIDDAFRLDAKSRVGLLPGLVLSVRQATEIILAPVEAISEGR